jgi:hypothetical protein
MTNVYSQPYSQIRNPDTSISQSQIQAHVRSHNSMGALENHRNSKETVLFANMLNFYSNLDQTAGKQLPYYEALDEDLILNLVPGIRASNLRSQRCDELEKGLRMSAESENLHISKIFGILPSP